MTRTCRVITIVIGKYLNVISTQHRIVADVAAPGRAGVVVAADITADAAGAGIRVGEGGAGTRNYVVDTVNMQRFVGYSNSIRGSAGMAGDAAETVVRVTVGFRSIVRIGGRIAVAAVAGQFVRSPGNAGDHRQSGCHGCAVAVAVKVRTVPEGNLVLARQEVETVAAVSPPAVWCRGEAYNDSPVGGTGRMGERF